MVLIQGLSRLERWNVFSVDSGLFALSNRSCGSIVGFPDGVIDGIPNSGYVAEPVVREVCRDGDFPSSFHA